MILKITYRLDNDEVPATDIYECHSQADEDSIPYAMYGDRIISITEVSL